MNDEESPPRAFTDSSHSLIEPFRNGSSDERAAPAIDWPFWPSAATSGVARAGFEAGREFVHHRGHIGLGLDWRERVRFDVRIDGPGGGRRVRLRRRRAAEIDRGIGGWAVGESGETTRLLSGCAPKRVQPARPTPPTANRRGEQLAGASAEESGAGRVAHVALRRKGEGAEPAGGVSGATCGAA